MTEKILLAHGSGGQLYHQLIEELFVPAFGNDILEELNDSAVCQFAADKLAMTTDSFVVDPVFFPGGNIGKMAVCGTVNDLSMSGAKPLYLSVGMIIETGFLLSDLRKITYSMAEAAKEAGVQIVTGDTKVVGKGQCDKIYINTAGVGALDRRRDLSLRQIAEGDLLVISGNVAEHGLAILAARENLSFTPPFTSDVAALNDLVDRVFCAELKALRDPTRGGVAATCHEWSAKSGLGVILEEAAIPISDATMAACNLLGLDPLFIANEGKFLAVVEKAAAPDFIRCCQAHPKGKNARIIGYFTKEHAPGVFLSTPYGSRRSVNLPSGEQLPRIC
ncbi:MAG: hydrogenase expression/formation protein HypE [Bacillota bacterium]